MRKIEPRLQNKILLVKRIKMKKIIIIILFIGISFYAYTQQCGNTSNGVTTNPDDPSYEDCPNLVNTFDWRNSIYHVPYYMGSYQDSIGSPFFNTGNEAIAEIWNGYSFNAPDFHPEDGWELVLNGITKTQQLPQVDEITYMVLYNKYTGILRVFGAHHDIGDYDYMEIFLTFNPKGNGNISALFNPAKQVAHSLDMNSLYRIHGKAMITGSNELHFFYADFPMGYDPCTCIFENKSIKVEFEAIDKQTLNIYGRSWGIDNDLANIDGGKGSINEDFLTTVYSDANKQTTAGSFTFNTWSELESHYDKQKAKKAQLAEQYKSVKNLKTALDYASFAAGFLPINFNIVTTIPPTGQTDTAKVESKNILNPLKIASKFVDVLAAPIKKKLDDASSSLEAIGKIRLIQSEIALSGEITNTTPREGFSFSLPGQANNSEDCDDNLGPLYDEVLGRFALLKKPKVKVGVRTQEYERRVTRTERIQFDVASFNNNYLFNPAANVDVVNTKIYGALVVKKTMSNNVALPITSNQLRNVEIVESLSENNDFVFITKFVPIECLGNLSAEIDLKNKSNPGIESSLDIQLRLIIFYEFNSIGSQGLKNQAFEVLTYGVDLSPTSINDMPLPITNAGGAPIQNKLPLGSINYTYSQTVFAWDTIIISGNLTVNTSGINVEIVAPEIIVESGASIGSGIQLRSKEYPTSCSNLSQVSHSNLSSYCKSNNYTANKPIPSKRQELVNNEDNVMERLYFNSSPNPFKESTQLSLTLPTTSEVSIVLYNILGQEMKTILAPTSLAEGDYNYTLNGDDLPIGVYYATIRWNGGVQTLSVVKH
jgi:hypothetical protein